MRHADRLAALAGGVCQAVIPLIAIQLQDPVKASQEGLCVLALAVGRVEEDDPRRVPLCQGSCPPLYFSSISQVGGIG